MKKYIFMLLSCILVILSGCSYFEGKDLQNAGMLFESSIENNAWNEKGYQALLDIEEEYQIDVFYRENVTNETEVNRAVDEFVKEGVNLIIGHGNSYGSHFLELTKTYPDVHFIYMNGDLYNSNVTSLNFHSHAMGFFGGMVAAEMSQTDHIGVLAVHSWQPEVEGFYEGATYQDPEASVHIEFVNDWDDTERALALYEQFKEAGVDVVVPFGNTYSEAVVEEAADDRIYSIGYIADQHAIAPDYVLTSMVQHVENIYLQAADDFNEGELVGGIRSYDFHGEFISLGTFNERVSDRFEDKVRKGIEEYKETNLLPNER